MGHFLISKLLVFSHQAERIIIRLHSLDEVSIQPIGNCELKYLPTGPFFCSQKDSRRRETKIF
jgi:hypothetical protein